MKKNMIRLFSFFIAIVLIAGCSSTKTTTQESVKPTAEAASGATKTPEKKNVTLKFSIWGNDSHKKMYDDMIVKFHEKNPNINVEIMTIPFADYQQKLTIMQASRTAPDLVWLAERMIPQFLTMNGLLDISSVKKDAEYKFDDFFPSSLELLTKDGKNYGIPFSTPPSMIYYNKTLFKEKGLATPSELYTQGKWNYEEYLKAAKALTDSSKGIYGTNLVRSGWVNWPDTIQTIFNSYGAELVSKDGKKFALNSKEGEQSLQFFSDLIFKDKVHPKPGDQTTFDSGKIAMQKELFSYMGKAKAVKDFEWDIAPLPAGPRGAGTTLGYGSVAIMKDTQFPEESIAFLKFITNPENMNITSQYFVPSRKSVLESDGFLKQGPSAESMKIAVIDQMAKAQTLPAFENWQNIDSNMRTALDYLYTQAPVTAVLKKAEDLITPLLK
ncbi:sugar ABC transporter substrate-binding protein [Paenibacillus alba]|uniref:ABC transporter substrate-binding protein n=1 Tax=Paenibacillus alba TaxID=1197127 RepID=UPI00156611F0|nr:sugar ABC transporter substrate-binding protein [Paenibacillus alba]NQX67027.1 sugar ABC transporter substrate-binding protein [Paenibacillus alba]